MAKGLILLDCINSQSLSPEVVQATITEPVKTDACVNSFGSADPFTEREYNVSPRRRNDRVFILAADGIIPYAQVPLLRHLGFAQSRG